MSERPHGYARYRLDGCRCNACGWAVSEYNRIREERIAAGTWRADTEPVRVHLRALSAAGVGSRRVTELTGINRKVLRSILLGRPERGTPPPKTTRYDIAQRILAVGVDLAPSATVEASGTVRRAQALCVIGWTVSDVGTAVGWTPQNFCDLVARGSTPYAAMVLARTAAALAALYERESMRPIPGPRGAAARARAHAREWFGPLAWDDDTIDDPDALPCVLPGERKPGVDEMRVQRFAAGFPAELTRQERAEVGLRMSAATHSYTEVAELLGVSRQAVHQWVTAAAS